MVNVEIKQDEKLIRKVIIDGQDVTKGCASLNFELLPGEIAKVTLTYLTDKLTFNDKMVK